MNAVWIEARSRFSCAEYSDARCGWSAWSACVPLSQRLRHKKFQVSGNRRTTFTTRRVTACSVEWVLDRTTVPEDEDIVATLVISGVTNPRAVSRPDLKKLEEFESRFIIPVDSSAQPPKTNAKEVRFTYQLRPRNRSVDRVPTLQFHYHNPAATKEKWFPLTTAREVRITVTAPRPKVEAQAIPMGEPEWLLSYAPRPVSLSRPGFSGDWLWFAIALGGPLAALAWFGGVASNLPGRHSPGADAAVACRSTRARRYSPCQPLLRTRPLLSALPSSATSGRGFRSPLPQPRQPRSVRHWVNWACPGRKSKRWSVSSAIATRSGSHQAAMRMGRWRPTPRPSSDDWRKHERPPPARCTRATVDSAS